MKSRLHHSPRPDSMKYVRLKNGGVVRLPNDQAFETVRKGLGEFCPKHVYRDRQKAEAK